MMVASSCFKSCVERFLVQELDWYGLVDVLQNEALFWAPQRFPIIFIPGPKAEAQNTGWSESLKALSTGFIGFYRGVI